MFRKNSFTSNRVKSTFGKVGIINEMPELRFSQVVTGRPDQTAGKHLEEPSQF